MDLLGCGRSPFCRLAALEAEGSCGAPKGSCLLGGGWAAGRAAEAWSPCGSCEKLAVVWQGVQLMTLPARLWVQLGYAQVGVHVLEIPRISVEGGAPGCLMLTDNRAQLGQLQAGTRNSVVKLATGAAAPARGQLTVEGCCCPFCRWCAGAAALACCEVPEWTPASSG